MRLVCRSVLATLLWVLTLALSGDAAFAIFQCGMFDGSFSCRAAPGDTPHGKNAPAIATPETSEPPPGAATGDAMNPAAPPYGAPAQGAVGYGTGAPPQGTPMPEPAKPGEHSCPPGYTVLATPGKYGYCQPPGGTAEATSGGCEHGMVGSPPNCHCPKNSELLGGNCVHYTATMCQSELPVNVNPEPCQDVEAKLSCKMRQDGLKDCCCLTYDKL
jgi:hypothetical protein